MRGRRTSSRLLALALTGAMLLPALTGVPALAASGYRIYTVEDLWAINNDPDGVYTLMNDLDVSEWNGGAWDPPNFSGTFYGNGHTISGVQTKNTSAYGLFWQLSGQCTIDGLTVRLGEQPVDCPVFSGGGGIAVHYTDTSPDASLTLSNCTVLGDVTISGYDAADVGGLVGSVYFNYNKAEYGTLNITGCRVEGDYIISADGGSEVGGLIGSSIGGTVTVSGCSYAGTLRSSYLAGGLFGYLSGRHNVQEPQSTIAGCTVEGNISAWWDGEIRHDPPEDWSEPVEPARWICAGGIAGMVSDDLTDIRDCQVSAAVSAENSGPAEAEYSNALAGGIVGDDNTYGKAGTISDCTVSGDVTARGPGASAQGIGGGMVYENCIVLGDVAAYADVPGFTADAGGVAIYGGDSYSEKVACFTNCTVKGAITAESLSSDAEAAGIVAVVSDSILTDCSVYGDVTAVGKGPVATGVVDRSEAKAAGISGGFADGVTFTRCRSYGDVTASGPNGARASAAGVAQGFIDPTNRLVNCSAAGQIRAESGSTAVEASGLLLGGGGIFRNCAFTGTAIRWNLSTGREYRDAYAFCDEPSTITGTAHNTSGLELCPDGAPEIQKPDLPEGAAVVTGSDGVSDYGETTQEYYSKGDYYFRVLVRGDSYPQTTGFTITIGDQTYQTGNRNDLNVDIPAGYTGDVVISKEGFYTYTLPNQYLRKYNWINLWPKGESTRPVIQSVLREQGASVSNYLLSQASTPIYVPDGTLWKLDVQVDWLDQTPGEVWLQQGDRRVDVVNGTTGPVALGTHFTVEGGTIYVCAQNAAGELTKVATTLKVRSKSFDVELDVGEPKSVTSTDNVDFLSNTKVEFDLPGILEAELSINEDGTFSALLGMKSKDKMYHKQAVGGIAELLDTINDEGVGADVDSALEKLFRETGVIPTAQSAKFSIPVSLSVYGYLEGRVVVRSGEVELEITEGGTLFKGSGGWSYTQLFPSGTYVQTGLTNSTQIKMVWSNGAQEPVTLKNTTSVKIGGGLGIPDIFSVGASGTGSLIFELTIPMGEDWDLYATYSFAVGEVSALGYKLTIHTYESDKYYWVRDGKFALGEREPQARMAQVAAEEDDFVPIPRDYLDRRGLKLLDAGDVDAPFRDNVLPGAAVQLAALPDGSLLAVWADDPGMETRPLASNRSALYYSLWKNGTWSQPDLVEDDGTADYSPALRVLNGKAYLVWMNAGETFTSEDVTLEQTAAAMDIRFASFDAATGQFKDFAAVCSNQVLDMLPDVLLLEEGPAVVWLSETANDLYNRTEAGSLYAARCVDGTWEEPQLLASGLSGVDSLTAGCTDPYGSSAQVWYSAGDPDDAGAKELCSYSFWWFTDGSLEAYPDQPTENDVPDTKPYWTEDGLSYYSGGTIQTPWGETGTDLPSDQYCLVTGDGVQAILFAQSGEDGNSDIYALFQDGGGWSEPVEVAQGGLLATSFAGAFDQNGDLHVFYSSVDVLHENADGSVETKTSLRHEILAPSAELAVTYADYQTASLIPGGTLNYFVTVENHGTRSANYIQAEMFQGETSLGTIVFLDSLPAGGTQTFSGSCVLPSDYTGGDLTVRVTALDEGFGETDLADNSLAISISPADVSVEEAVAVQTEDGKVLVTALAANYGLTAAEELTVTLEDRDGNPLEAQTIQSLDPGEAMGVEFLSDQLQPDTLYVLTIAEQAGERAVSDNRCPFQVIVPEDGVTLSQSSCRFLEDGTALIQAVVDNPTDGDCAGTLLAAVYQGEKLVETQQVLLTVEGSSTMKCTLILDTAGTDCRVKIFYLETDTKEPLAPSTTFQMS